MSVAVAVAAVVAVAGAVGGGGAGGGGGGGGGEEGGGEERKLGCSCPPTCPNSRIHRPQICRGCRRPPGSSKRRCHRRDRPAGRCSRPSDYAPRRRSSSSWT